MNPKPPPEAPLSALDPSAVQETAKELADHAAEFIRKHPFESVGGALVAGVLIGLLISRK